MTTEDTTTPVTETTDEQEPAAPDLKSLLADLPNAPDQSIIDGWKVKYGNVFMSGFDETEIYIWRVLNRAEYKQMQIDQQIQAMGTQLGENASKEEVAAKVTASVTGDYAREDKLVSACLLWPKLTVEELSVKAGTIPSLLEEIVQNSNFLTPQQASMLVIKL